MHIWIVHGIINSVNGTANTKQLELTVICRPVYG